MIDGVNMSHGYVCCDMHMYVKKASETCIGSLFCVATGCLLRCNGILVALRLDAKCKLTGIPMECSRYPDAESVAVYAVASCGLSKNKVVFSGL